MEDDRIISSKHKTEKMCAITNEILDNSFESKYAKELLLSSKGTSILLNELQNCKK